MSQQATQSNWETFDTAFPSFAEYNAPKEDGDEIPAGDAVEDGSYRLEAVDITAPMQNKFPDPRSKNPKPIRFVYWRVLKSDDPGDVGKLLRKKMTDSGHPMSSAYPFLQAAYGGNIPPDVKPRFSQLRGCQIDVFLTTRKGIGDGGREYSFQAWEAIRPVPSDKRTPSNG